MKKKLIAIAVAAVLAPAAAVAGTQTINITSDITIYGRAHVSVDGVSGIAANTNNTSVNSNSSRLGVKGEKRKGLVLIVADTDTAALEVAQSISAGAHRNVFAVMGGAETWRRVSTEASPDSKIPDSFVIPANTCEQGKPIQELKRNKPWQESESK